MRGKRPCGGGCYGERAGNIRVQAGVCADLSRMRDRIGKRMAVSLYRGTVWRSGLCGHLYYFSADHGSAHHVHGVRRWPGQPKEHHHVLSGVGAEGDQLALVRLVRHGGQLSADDVLHHHLGLAAAVLLQTGDGQLCGDGRRTGQPGLHRYADAGRVGAAAVHGACGRAGYGGVQQGAEKTGWRRPTRP